MLDNEQDTYAERGERWRRGWSVRRSKEEIKVKEKRKAVEPKTAGSDRASQTNSDRKLLALRYASLGLPVVPLHGKTSGRCTCGNGDCEQPGRHPRTPNGIAGATTDSTEVEKTWNQWPNARIAIVTGAPDIIAVKVTVRPDEGRENRPDGWLEIVSEYGLPTTVGFRRRNSQFYLFKADHRDVPEGELQLTKGVTVIGKGGCVRLPDSFDARDTNRFDPGCAVGEVRLATAPRRLTDMLRAVSLPAPMQPLQFQTYVIPFDLIWVRGMRADAEKVRPTEKVSLLAESMDVTKSSRS
jgi:hypothetical protein